MRFSGTAATAAKDGRCVDLRQRPAGISLLGAKVLKPLAGRGTAKQRAAACILTELRGIATAIE